MTGKDRFLRISWIIGLVIVSGALVAFIAVVFTIVTFYSILGSNGQIAYLCVSGVLFTIGLRLFVWINHQIDGLFKGLDYPKKKRKRKPKEDVRL